MEWLEYTLSQAVQGEERFVLFCDNLTAQVLDEFRQAVSILGGVVWYGLPNATDLWQPVDGGYAQLLKSLIGQAQRRWLDDEDNAEKWYGHDKQFTAKERRILITHWCALAYRRVIGEEYDHLRLRVWQKTGCLMTANGSDDEKITPEGLPNYVVPPPTILEPSKTGPQVTGNSSLRERVVYRCYRTLQHQTDGNYPDKTLDYLTTDDMDGIEVRLEDK